MQEMNDDGRTVSSSVRAHLTYARRNYPDLELRWGFALVPYAVNESLAWLGEQPDARIDYIGAVSMRGTQLPLTPALVRTMEHVCWMKGLVASVLAVPSALDLLEAHAPLPYLGLSMVAGPTTPAAQEAGNHRAALSAHLEPDDLKSPVIMLTTGRPESWPP